MNYFKYIFAFLLLIIGPFAAFDFGYRHDGLVGRYADLDEKQLSAAIAETRLPAATAEEVVAKALKNPLFDKRFGEYLQVMGFTYDKDAKGNAIGSGAYDAINNTANSGIEKYQLDLLAKNPCFAELAQKFYRSINAEEDGLKAPLHGKKLGGRPSLADVCDESNDCEPGYVWKRAMQFAQNDRALAISLIGICGHDDAAHAFMDCPLMFSKFFLPGSLGVQFDLSKEMKNRIATTQAPTKGAGVLPAKYYHVIGGAFASCLLTRRGVPGFIAEMVQSKGIVAYRSRAICELPMNMFTKVKDERQREVIMDAFAVLGTTPNAKKITNCSDVDIENTTYKTMKSVTSKNCPKHFTAEKCAVALSKIKTWVVDFEWSLAQHKIGVDFAKANCPNIGVDTNPVQNACAALGVIKK